MTPYCGVKPAFQIDQNWPELITNGSKMNDFYKPILGTKIHVTVESNGLPVLIVCSPANVHDNAKFIDVIEDISEFADDSLIQVIIPAYAEKGYDAKYIKNHLRCYGIDCSIPYKKNPRNTVRNKSQKHHGKTRLVAERFSAWPKCGFHRITVRYEGTVIIVWGLSA